MSDQLTFHHLLNPRDPLLLDLQRIYVESIPPSTRKPNEWLTQIIARKDYLVLMATMLDRVVGFAIAFSPLDEPMALLEYFAIDANHRSQGLGTHVFREIVRVIGNRALLIEVDSIDPAKPNQSENIRRQAFYRRLGCQRVAGLAYILPLKPAPPMDLFIANPPEALTTETVAKWLMSIYQRVYDCLPDDPRLSKMVKELTDPVRLE